jgi:hypothetical protein
MADLDEVANVVAAVLRTEQSMMCESKATGYCDLAYKNFGLVGSSTPSPRSLWRFGSLYQVGDFGVAQRKLYDLHCC